MPIRTQVFNQYYFSFLKKIKDIAREIKHANLAKDPEASYSKILKAIKTHYASYDTSSSVYVDRFLSNESVISSCENWSTTVNEYKDVENWCQIESVQNAEFYENILFKDIYTLVKSKEVVYYNLAILFIFSKDLEDVQYQQIVEFIKNIKNKDQSVCEKILELIENVEIRRLLEVLKETHNVAMISSVDTSFKQLEETSLGKLAKEIMNDINLDEIQSSLQQDNDIFKSLGNPEGGFTKLLSSVSQKMISKLASGEIKQETLLQDAMMFSSQLNNIMPGANSSSDDNGLNMGGIGAMFEQLQQMTGGAGGAGGAGGLGGLQEMMSALGMGGGMPVPPARANTARNTQPRTDSSTMARTIKAKQLRTKLEKKKQLTKSNSSKENVQTHVEENE